MNPIITAGELIANMEAGEEYVLVDTRTSDDWRVQSITGAISLNVYDYFIPESTEDGIHMLASDTWLAMQKTGLDRAERVIFFEEDTGMRSPRGLWFHELMGLSGGRILDGGLAAWQAAGGSCAPGDGIAGEIVRDPAISVIPAGFRRELIATTARTLQPEADVDVLDTRRPTEFDGSFAHPCCQRSGRIPGSAFLFYEDMLHDGRYLPGTEILAKAVAAGLNPVRPVITYCHRGARAATALYGLRLAGFDRVGIYVGSWHEWAAHPDLPIETGNVG